MLSVCARGCGIAKATPERKRALLFSTTGRKCRLLPPQEGKKQNQQFRRTLGRITMSFQADKAL